MKSIFSIVLLAAVSADVASAGCRPLRVAGCRAACEWSACGPAVTYSCVPVVSCGPTSTISTPTSPTPVPSFAPAPAPAPVQVPAPAVPQIPAPIIPTTTTSLGYRETIPNFGPASKVAGSSYVYNDAAGKFDLYETSNKIVGNHYYYYGEDGWVYHSNGGDWTKAERFGSGEKSPVLNSAPPPPAGVQVGTPADAAPALTPGTGSRNGTIVLPTDNRPFSAPKPTKREL